MFDDSKSKKFVTFSVGAVLILVFILIGAFFISGRNNYTTVKVNETYRVGNKNLKVFGINKSKEYLYLEFIDEEWLDKNSNFKFTAVKKNNTNEIIDGILKMKYKGYYLIKIPLEKGYGSIKLNTNYDNKDYPIYFNEHQIKETDYKEPTLKEYKVIYLKEVIRSVRESMEQKQNDIIEERKKIDTLEKEREEIKAEFDFLQGEELQKRKSHLTNVENNILNIKDTILNFENDLIKYENKIEVIGKEIIFIETGERRRAVLKDLKDKNGNIITDTDAKTYDEKITKEEVKEENKEKENKENNSSEKNTTTHKIENNTNNTNSNYNNQQNNNYNNNQNNNSNTNKNNSTPIKDTETNKNNNNTNTQNNQNKKIIKPIKNDKEKKEIEVEFKP